MWPFRARSKLSAEQLLRLEVLERRLKVIEVEWEDWFAKYRRLYARLAKRVSDEEKNAPGSTESHDHQASHHPHTPPMSPLAARLLRGPNHPGGIS